MIYIHVFIHAKHGYLFRLQLRFADIAQKIHENCHGKEPLSDIAIMKKAHSELNARM